MEALREYVLSVVSAAILCGMVCSIAGKKGSTGAILKLITGLILTFTVIHPIAQVKLEELTLFTSDLALEAEAASAMGEEIYEESLAAIIKAETESYILDKAQSLNAVLTVDVRLNAQSVPEEVTVTGQVSPYAKQKLQSIIEAELGVPKERQIWIG